MGAVQWPRIGRARTGLHQGLSHWMFAFRNEIGNERTGGNPRRATARELWLPRRGSLRSARSRRNARDLRLARRKESRVVWWVAERSARPALSAAVERAVEVARESGDGCRHRRHGIPLHAIWAEEGRRDQAG